MASHFSHESTPGWKQRARWRAEKRKSRIRAVTWAFVRPTTPASWSIPRTPVDFVTRPRQSCRPFPSYTAPNQWNPNVPRGLKAIRFGFPRERTHRYCSPSTATVCDHAPVSRATFSP